MLTMLKNALFNHNKYKTHPEAVIVACYFNPQKNPYRLLAFQKWYHSIKHLNHRIIECVIPPVKPDLPKSQYISTVHSESLLWHKETLLNKIFAELPEKFRYVFWLDADVLFTNLNWLVDGVKELQTQKIIQPFDYCFHLDKNEKQPNKITKLRSEVFLTNQELKGEKKSWRSFAATYVQEKNLTRKDNYDLHGHVGFAWGARREVLDRCPLFDRALIGGADHIIAHAAVGQILHPCIEKSFCENLNEIEEWSNKFYFRTAARIGYVTGDLYHLWHGDIKNRKYLQRIREFNEEICKIKEKDKNGLYKTKYDKYVRRYYREREDHALDLYSDEEFFQDMGYTLVEWAMGLTQQTIYDNLEESFDSPLPKLEFAQTIIENEGKMCQPVELPPLNEENEPETEDFEVPDPPDNPPMMCDPTENFS